MFVLPPTTPNQFIEAISVVVDPTTPHGCFVDSCPNQRECIAVIRIPVLLQVTVLHSSSSPSLFLSPSVSPFFRLPDEYRVEPG